MLDAVKEHVLDVGLLGEVESMRRAHLYVILLELLQLPLKYGDVQISRTVIGFKEAAYALLGRGLRAFLSDEQIDDEVANCVVG